MRATLVAQLGVDKVRRRRAAVGVLRGLWGAVDVVVIVKMLRLCTGIFGKLAVVAVRLGGEGAVGDDASALAPLGSLVTKVDLFNVSIRHGKPERRSALPLYRGCCGT